MKLFISIFTWRCSDSVPRGPPSLRFSVYKEFKQQPYLPSGVRRVLFLNSRCFKLLYVIDSMR